MLLVSPAAKMVSYWESQYTSYTCALFYSNGVSGGDDDEWDYSDRTFDPNKPGVPVRALYDYEGVEADELSFKVGKFIFCMSQNLLHCFVYISHNFCKLYVFSIINSIHYQMPYSWLNTWNFSTYVNHPIPQGKCLTSLKTKMSRDGAQAARMVKWVSIQLTMWNWFKHP